jgi:hypothetical protein
MHRSYSLRQSRAPTAAQIQTPPPPQSSTKHRFFGSGTSFGLSIRKGTAGAFAPELAKRLSQLIKMEKSLMRSIELVFHFYCNSNVRLAERGRKSQNNSLYGVRNATMTSPTSRTNSESSSSKSVNWKTTLSVHVFYAKTHFRSLRSIPSYAQTDP